MFSSFSSSFSSSLTKKTLLNSQWWSAACDWVMSALSAVLSTRIGRHRKFVEVSCTECTGQGNDFELIPTVDIEILFWKFSWHRLSCCVPILWNMADRKSVKSSFAYLTKKLRLALQLMLLSGSCPKSAPTMYCRLHPNQFSFGGVWAKRANTTKTCHKMNPIFGWSLASSRITMVKSRHLRNR